ncbi:MAG: tetratricopeptide repeat protein, partial [Bdellovibrionota bacterium]
HPTEETERQLHELLYQARALEKRDLSREIELTALLARSQGLQGKLDDARGNIKKAEQMLEGAESYRVSAKICFLIEKGRLMILEKIPSQARPLFAEAWQLAGNSGEDYFRIEAAQLLAAIEPQKVQKEWILKALALSETSPQPRARRCQGSLFATLGWMQFEMRQYDTALGTFQKALSCIQAEALPRKRIVAKWAIARTLRALNRVDEALEMQKDLLAEAERTNMKDGYVYEELAECLQTLKKTTEAQVYFDLAYRELSKNEWLADNKAERIKRLKGLGKVK